MPNTGINFHLILLKYMFLHFLYSFASAASDKVTQDSFVFFKSSINTEGPHIRWLIGS